MTRAAYKQALIKRVVPALLLFLLIVAFYWKFTLSGQYELMWSPDLAFQVVPWLNVAARQWSSWTFPLWDPHLWGGQPLLGQAQPGAAYPLNWILFSLPRRNGLFSADIFHWYFAVIHFMAAFFCYLLCRDLHRSVPASMIAGLTFSLTTYLTNTGWPQMLNGVVWAPLVFLFLLRSVEGRKPGGNAALAGLCLGVSWLSGHHQVPLILTAATTCIWCFYAVQRRRIHWPVLRKCALGLLICSFVGALQILPAREYGQHALRWVGAADPVTWDKKVPYFIHEQFSITPSSVVGIVIPGFGGSGTESFVGFTALTLALIGLAAGWRDRRVRVFTFVGIAGFFYALGGSTLFEGIIYAVVPMIEKARAPFAAIFLFGLAVSVLASYGVDTLGHRVGRVYAHRHSRGLAVIGLLLTAAVFVFTITKVNFDQRLALVTICVLLLSALLAAFRVSALRFRHTVMLCGLLVLTEAYTVGMVGANKISGDLMGNLNTMRSNLDIAQYLRRQNPPFRIAIDGEHTLSNWAAYHGFDTMGGYLASLSVNIGSVAVRSRNVALLWGTRYWIRQQAGGPEDVEVFAGQSGQKVFQNSSAFPRAWIVHQIEKTDNRGNINKVAEADMRSFATRAFMTSDPPVVDRCTETDTAEYRRPTEDTVMLTAHLGCKGLLVVSDTFFPGWKVDVDGRSTEMYEVNGAMRGVVVPAGTHTVVMRYRPASAYVGGFLSLSGLLTAVAIAYRSRRSRSIASAHQEGAYTSSSRNIRY